MKIVHLTGLNCKPLPGLGASSWKYQKEISGLTARSRVRLWPFAVLLVALGLILPGRLFLLTVVEGAYHREQADLNRMVAIRTAAPRGIIFDQNDEALTINRPAYKHQLPGSAIQQAQFVPVDKDEAIRLSRVSGERVFYDVKRDYVCGAACAPLLGYMGEVTTDELQLDSTHYILGDLTGKSGVEKLFESDLRGTPGSEMIEVDSQGKLIRVIGKEEYRAGKDIRLTVNRGLQEMLYSIFEGKPGAAVAQVPQTGEILALVSSPAYDPSNIAASLTQPDNPFFNRAVAGVYPPGSVFKIVSAVAGMETGIIDSETMIEDTGEIVIDTYRFGNWYYDRYGRTEGMVNVEKALQRSNDIFFYRLGEKLTPGVIGEWAHLLGYAQVSTLASLGEVAGLIPSPEWKEKTLGERWFLGNTYHMAIGQGDVMVTPLQVNRMMGAVAADGVLCDPLLLKQQVGKQSCRQLNLKPETLDTVQAGLVKACQPGGTGTPFFHFSPQVACKTGSAQQGGKEANPHSWFTVYAPAAAPEIVLTVLVEKAGEGSEIAAPLAYKALDYWFHNHKE